MNELVKKIGTKFSVIWRLYVNLKSELIKYPKSSGDYNSISIKDIKQYNKDRLFGAKSLFCYNPFINLFFDTYGNGIACCRSHKTILGTYPNNSIKEIWNGEKINVLRKHMLNNDLSYGCDYCKLQLKSKRYQAIPSLNSEEYATTSNIEYPRIIEFELANTCNLQCVMCSGRVSSTIRINRENLEPLFIPYDDAFVEQLKEFIPYLKRAYFYGGEPFLIGVYYKIWDEIIRINPKIKLYAVSNGTVMNEKIKNILQKTHFNIIVSLDSLNKEKAESIRVGCIFEEVKKNIFLYTKYSGNRVSISHTPMTINWSDTPEIIQFCNENNFRINLSYVEGPARFALWSLIPEELSEIYSFYNKIEWKDSNKNFTSKYNIRVFNQLKEQVLFFRNRNQEILSSYGNIDKDWNNENDKFAVFFNGLKANNDIEIHKINNLETALQDVVSELAKTPWNLEELKSLSSVLSSMEIIKSPEFQRYLNNPKLLKDEFFIESKQAEFFQKYY